MRSDTLSGKRRAESGMNGFTERTHERAARVVDIHSHILPGMDDGAADMEETIKMMRIAAEEGITHIIATPHYKSGKSHPPVKVIRSCLESVRNVIKEENIPVSIYVGNEVLFFAEMVDRIDASRILTLNDSLCILVEFMPMDGYQHIRNALDEVAGMGLTPIIAHIERYECMLKHPQYAQELYDMGVQIQVNAAAVTGKMGWKVKRFVHELLRKQLVTYIATDAHDAETRIPAIKKCQRLLYRRYDSDYADAILYRNAVKNILRGKKTCRMM